MIAVGKEFRFSDVNGKYIEYRTLQAILISYGRWQGRGRTYAELCVFVVERIEVAGVGDEIFVAGLSPTLGPSALFAEWGWGLMSIVLYTFNKYGFDPGLVLLSVL